MESTAAYTFDIPKGQKSIIKAIGVGGGGSNAINYMYLQGIKGVEFIVCNTDTQALNSSGVPYKLQIGRNLTEGLGCGANPEIGRAAALESKDQIRDMLSDTKMAFVTAGMGGGTGTGAAPVLAKIAKDMGILTVGIVTLPFSFEGKKKQAQAEAGVQELRTSCDTVLVILNEKLREIYGNLPVGQAFAKADNVLTMAAKGIAEIITLAGYVNVDFQDVRTVMHNAGGAVMGSAETHGEDRALKAAREALSSPLLDNHDIMGAKRILLSIVSGEEAELQMDELTQITEYIQQQAGSDAEMIFGHGVDSSAGDRIRVTVIATDFAKPEERMLERSFAPRSVRQLDDEGQVTFTPAYHPDDSVAHQAPEITLKKKTESSPHAEDGHASAPDASQSSSPRRGYEFTFPNDTPQQQAAPLEQPVRPPVTDSNLEVEPRAHHAEEDLNSLSHSSTRERLRKRAMERREELRLSNKRGGEMSREELNEKWNQPAYVRRGVKLSETPHSSQPYVSRYNLGEDNNLIGNNRFLHDNVD